MRGRRDDSRTRKPLVNLSAPCCVAAEASFSSASSWSNADISTDSLDDIPTQESEAEIQSQRSLPFAPKTLQTANNSHGIIIQLQKQNFGFLIELKNTDTESRVFRINFYICNSWCGFFRTNFCICNLLGGLLELFSVSVILARVSKVNFCICSSSVAFCK